MYKLFWDPGAANMAPHAVLEEIGCPYELVKVDLAKGEHRMPEYMRLNPNGRVPTLIDGEKVMFEAAAIVLYLVEKHREAKLAPPPGTPERMLFLQWLAYLTNTLQEAFMQYFYPEHFATDPKAQENVKATAEARLETMWGTIDTALAANGPYLAGNDFTAADLYLHMLSRWSRGCRRTSVSFPHVKRLIELVKARPAVQRMIAQEGLTEPF
ncbi:MAG: glutathione S-transferase N-terminal domain-containing protein [Rhodospirillales bacterium]|nr:glutathione S-transferase N-terminal domain-containing protein [Rhodospirillales bacterium]